MGDHIGDYYEDFSGGCYKFRQWLTKFASCTECARQNTRSSWLLGQVPPPYRDNGEEHGNYYNGFRV